MRSVSRCVTLGMFSLTLAVGVDAASIDRWSASTEREFLLGTFEGTAIDRDGRIELAPQTTHLWGPESGIVWDIVPGRKGSVFVALSGPGQVLFIDADGAATAWYQADDESLITALAPDGKGGVYAGISPQGRILHLRAPGETTVVAETGTTFVWALKTGPGGTLWAGTGVPGQIQRYRKDGGPETLFETGDDPVRSLVVGTDGVVIAGTGGRGRVIRLERGSPFVLFDASEAEIVALAREADGTVWALAAGGVKQPSSRPPATQGPVTRVRVTAEAPPRNGNSDNDSEGDKKPESERPAASFRASGGGALYRISRTAIDTVWTTSDAIPFDMTLDGDGTILIATGDKGQVWRVDPSGKAARMIPIASNQASAITSNAAGQIFVAGTSDARVERFERDRRQHGRYLSLPIEAGTQARWGRVSWDADVPEGSSISAAVRVGNTTEPDETWSAWVDLADDGQIDSSALPASRLIQVRLKLADGESAGPRVSSLQVSYEPRNRAPEIESLTVEPPGVVIVPVPAQSTARLGPLVADDPVTRSATSGAPRGRARSPVRRGWEAGARTFSWAADDPDDDRLTYRLDIRAEGDLYWFPLAAGLTGTYYSWDARSTPDGKYRVRLTASDQTDNPSGDALTRAEISPLFVVDNSRPALTEWSVERSGAGREVAFTAVDPGGSVAAVEVAMDAGDWLPLFPEDGVADSDVERYRLILPTEGQSELPASMRVRITDAAGNLGGALKQVDAD